VEPTPLTIVILKDNETSEFEYKMYNVERGTKLEYKPSIHGHSKSHIHNTGKVIWVNNNATQKMSPFTRRELMRKKVNGDIIAENEALRLHLLKK
jgi:hypothetical protein